MESLFDQQIIGELKEIMGDDIGILLETFISDSNEKLNELSDAISQCEPEQVRRTAHSLKGSSRNVGAAALALLCEKLEYQARSEDLSEAKGLLSQILKTFSETESEIHAQF